jgi:hypothetical protein
MSFASGLLARRMVLVERNWRLREWEKLAVTP